MARKNVLLDEPGEEASASPDAFTALQEKISQELGAPSPGPTSNRPFAHMVAPKKPMTSPLAAIAAGSGAVARVKELEKQLADSQAVVEIDPSLIEGSIVPDRMAGSIEDHDKLVTSIRLNGQQVPILVRPHPSQQGHYQVAYGHRRLRAVTELGQKVRAVVRDLTDEQLVVAQGQENNERTNLSFIEKARFAARLEDRRFSRETILQALCTDKGTLSKMISVGKGVPLDIIEAIGPAPAIGLRRWKEFADLLNKRTQDTVRKVIEKPEFERRDSDARFEMVFKALIMKPGKAQVSTWSAPDGVRLARYSDNGEKFSLIVDQKFAPDFGRFLVDRLEALYSEYKNSSEK
ncbi:plasmid partitioning protein RepB [Microvirga sp. KLBC 81]|uniref:plasmid partitioning protein RepB n=1 Tax=Microvirga sp. KLBC 81 TaxID=1862707 RepID=UPI000D506CF6|nr:plasmid partitioning protein RepB [Microvirga sp. KLBC 81]PVE20527.1 plasmid partitioning protein RepB [Microvirga sp. KLBC 81]